MMKVKQEERGKRGKVGRPARLKIGPITEKDPHQGTLQNISIFAKMGTWTKKN
jgi:hypothetical protein